MTDWITGSGQTVRGVHDPSLCEGQGCPVHHPSDHPLLEYPTFFQYGRTYRVVQDSLVLDPDDEDFLRRSGMIVRNAARCLNCRDVVESRHVHDFVSCSCGQLSVDGGHDYARRCGSRYEDLTEW